MTLSARVYGSSPTWLQHVLVSTYGWHWRRLRLGGKWATYVREFREREGWDRERWHDYSEARLRRLLLAAREQVPYYSARWKALGIGPEMIARMTPKDLPELPILSKQTARSSPRELLIGGRLPRGAKTFHTSGSTGTPIATYWTADDLQRSLALREARSAGWAGVSYQDSRATFSGRMVVPDSESSGPYHRYNVFERQVYFSAFHLSPASVATYVAALRRHRPTWLTGYAYSWYTLARLAGDEGLDCPSPRAVITTSEKVTPPMRSVMEDFFGCKVYEEYGTVEDVMYVSECERGGLHSSPDAGIVEIVDDAGKPVGPGKTGQVVATGFVRGHQLFVRFALGDEAAWADTTCPCGREMPLLQEVTGRTEDAVVGPDGREMVRFHGIFVDQPHVVEGQVVQETLREITVNVVPTSGYGSADAEEIRRRVQTRLTPEVDVNVRTVSTIPRNAAGKYQAVISRVPSSAVRPGTQ